MKRQLAFIGGNMQKTTLPKCLDVWKEPAPRSQRRRIARALAPYPDALKYYPELPRPGQRVWALWRCGRYGTAEYLGGWTYKADGGGFLNEMPVCWHEMKANTALTGRAPKEHQ